MRNDFKNFLNTRKKKGCNCVYGETWCSNCLNFGEEVSVKLPDGKISKGFIKTNLN